MIAHESAMGDIEKGTAERRHDLRKVAVAITGEAGRQATLRAKGRGAVAEQILDMAFAHDVKVREDAALTQMLETVELDSPVPWPALNAVCDVLTKVYEATSRPSLASFKPEVG
jgi:flagellar biosynthesis protein